MRSRPPRLYDFEMAWWQFIICALVLILFIVGEWFVTVILMTLNLPFVVFNHVRAYYRDTYQ